ncbi:ABC transporter substrate-binding protein [Paenibacillus glucanolyticus]|jgi:sn-glycerol 3-phosphate transport system substrate-binding protein|uniref:ABC transporter substrate-binding protein n=1 Tax=Paenibacillus TaxID=44249 RepID=UPI0003E1E780|nr:MULTISPECIES: ABC transporter substrate-binding protein [Paenibacillus]ANA80847.1 ABC transporter substrate-binding protein [Paenibacillus glucanolyticus]AVV55081.1 ABC transporter substrate-binding protein [Paenibacillus glucanolyticus]AWP29671.1 ABC transporter substrate-binding protein [Paenibacillus sp. Cedars]ETT40556.1 family 1 extracellular solute-binding protein [Paenibacillus sp. FSL R5-808]MDH6673274.1 sn-glycerol 3-phosphate transport system substrate-binding protein [Paenibacill
MKSKWYSLLSVILLFSLLAACSGGGSGETGEAPGGGGTEAPSGDKGKTTVQFWHSLGGKNGEYMDALIQRFNASHEDIEVVGTFQGSYDETVTKLQQAIASGTGPDVSMLERAYVQMFADSEVLEDLTPYLEGSGISVDDFTPGLMGHSTFNDQLVSLPLNRSTPILHVNKTLLDELGLQIPTTWEEMKEVANALVVKEGSEYKRYGVTMPYDTWYPIAMISQAGGTFFNDDHSSIGFGDNGAGTKMFAYLKDLQSTGALYYPPAQDSGNIVNSMFVEGKVGMMYQSTGSIGGLSSTVDFDYVTAFLPKDEVYANPTGGANVTMLSSSKNKEAAWEFIRWMEMEEEGGLEFILQSGYLPFTKKMVESEKMQALWAKEPNRKVAYDQLEFAVDTNKDVAWPEIMHEFFSAIEAIMYDSKDIPATLDTFKKETERILAQ